MKIKDIQEVKLSNPVPVYDIEVPKYHNFLLDAGIFVHNSKIFNVDYDKVEKWQRGLAKNSVFGILYGESIQTYATSYLKGDVDRAQEIFDDMFTRFPGIKLFIEKAHRQFNEYGKITTLTNRTIRIDDPKADYNALLRQSQNFVIQSSCFTGDTKIKLSDSESMRIDNLINLPESKRYCLSYTKDTNSFKRVRFTDPHKTKDVTELARIILSDGTILECTLDHRFMLSDCSYVNASFLRKNMKLMSYNPCDGDIIVKNVDIVNLKSPVPVYDITVPIFDNFVIDCNSGSGIAVHNSEDIAGIIMYQIIKYINEHNMKSKVWCFVHDSIEIDLHPFELFPLIDVIDNIFNNYPRQTFNVPVEADIPIGPSLGQECIVKKFEHDDAYNDIDITLEGVLDDVYELYEIWKEVYKTVEIVSVEETDCRRFSYGEMFLPKKAKISTRLGTDLHEGKIRFHIIVK